MDTPYAKKLYHSDDEYDASALPDDAVTTTTLQRAVADSGLSYAEVARRMGWMHPDTQRVRRELGLRADVDGRGTKRFKRAIDYDRAVEIIRALHLDPVDYGL